MADTLTLQIEPETAAELRRIAAQSGQSVEMVAQVLLEEAVIDVSAPQPTLSDEQLADLRERLKDPGPNASNEEVAAFFSRFKA